MNDEATAERDRPGDEPAKTSTDDRAGPDSPHLDAREQDQAATHAAPAALVIHEVVREEGEAELQRRTGTLIWSGLASGLSMGFSLLAMGLVTSRLPDQPWRRLIDSPGYSVGFVIAILGRQQLFTESTLTAVLPLMVRRDRPTLLAVLRMWGVVLSSNIVGTVVFAALVSRDNLFEPSVRDAMIEIGRDIVSGTFAATFVKAILAGWLIATMVWLLPSARSARILVIMLLTYVVALGRFPHIVAGSVDATFAVFTGAASVRDYFVGFFVPTLLGNTLGGVTLVAFLNHAPLAPDLQGEPR